MEARPLACSDIVEALSRPVETTTATLIRQYEWEAVDVLDAIARVQGRLDAWDVESDPPLGRFDLDYPRILKRKGGSDAEALTSAALKNFEDNECEFKETLCFDVKKNELGGRPPKECYSDEVLLSSLKTIAAFSNTAGGVLYVGISDERIPKGIERDYGFFSQNNQNFDGWELFLRGKIEQFFHNGKGVSSSVHVERVVLDGREIARLTVGSRKALTVIKWIGGDMLFIRNGNQTLSITIAEIEHHFELKKLYIQ
jgi:hypothetical protein